MKKLLVLIAILFFFSISYTFSQSIIVNPNGTHSVVVGSGSVRTAINSDGTHSTVIGHGRIKTIINPNGTHSTLVNHGTIGTVVNPNNTHSTSFKKNTIRTFDSSDRRSSMKIYRGRKIFKNKNKSVFGFSLQEN
ncbi:hypothetical protein [Chitinophaga flava]|uniref:Uncharacterized protein n=1 Tax=Chitinophaga flava TaxID=2259036 RepID=A0A365XUC8_9BACT|nr:hypothetical protein [Chitinophaga flava]RBL89304.1 hypothetical protein DF182_22545 [Chitinophaga flava]